MGERARGIHCRSALSLSLCSFYVTFLEQNHQLNHLPPADFYKICLWASSEFCRHYTEKTSPVTLTVFLINPLGNFPHTHGFFGIIVCDTYFLAWRLLLPAPDPILQTCDSVRASVHVTRSTTHFQGTSRDRVIVRVKFRVWKRWGVAYHCKKGSLKK